jgi:hypothetical protein
MVLVNTITKQLRELRPDALSSHTCQRILECVIAIEKAAAAIKLLLLERATEHSGAAGAADDLARRSGTSKKKAKETLDAAKRLKDQPELEDALRDGELSGEQASMISDAAAANPSATSGLVDRAKTEPLKDLRDACGRAKAAADPDEEGTRRRLHASRSFQTGRDTDGASTGWFRGPARDHAEFMANLQPFRDQIFKANRAAGRHDTSGQMDYDALMAMARAAHAKTTGTTSPEKPAPRPATTVYMVVDWARFRGRETGGEAAYIAGFGPVAGSVVRDVMNDAFLVGVVKNGKDIVKIKRWGRYVPVEVRDALRLRHDFRCSTPGCGNWMRIERDHVIPFSKGGETSYDNLDGLCHTCHKKKTKQDRLFWDTG